MAKVILLVSFVVATPALLVFSVLFLSLLSFQKKHPTYAFATTLPKQSLAYAALPTTQNTFGDNIYQEDARPEIIRQFMAKYKSPLEPFAATIVATADKYALDFRLIPAIAMQESNVCHKIPTASYNCWGFGIYGTQVRRFSDYDEAIEIVTKTLAKEYKGKGLHTPTEIMAKYTPSSNGSWAKGVNHFMEQLQ